MRDLAAVFEIISSISSTLALDEILAAFTEKTAQIIGVDCCAISSWDRDLDAVVVLADYLSPEAIRAAAGVDDVGAAYPLDRFPATAQVLHQQKPLVVYVDDATADEYERDLLRAFQCDGVLMVPMLYQGQTIGLLELYVADQSFYQFSPDDIALCQALANQAAVAIENSRLYQEAEEARLHAESMQVISRVLASELDFQRLMRKVANFAYRLVHAQFVYVATPEGEGFRLIAVAGSDKTGKTAKLRLDDTPSILLGPETLNRVLRGPVVVPDIQRDPTSAVLREEAVAQGWRAMVAVPLLSYNQVLGVLVAFAPQRNYFNPNAIAILMSLTSQAAVAIQNARLLAEREAQREALHQISLRLVNAQEEERRRISRELHDELGQALTALKINLEVGSRALPSEAPPALRQSLREASFLAVRTLERARSMSLDLHPAVLDDLGLVSALQWEIDRYEQRTGQIVHFEAVPADVQLQPELEITVYRIVSEALTNVARHAGAGQISVSLRVRDQHVVTRIEDDGVGFDAAGWFSSPRGRHSLGLTGMRERAELLGGQFEITSQPGRGTKIWVKLPARH